MWALRRASLSLRNRGFSIGTSRACCASSELPTYIQEDPCFVESRKSISDGCLSSKRLYYTTHAPSYFIVDSRGVSSHAGAKSSGKEDELEDGCSELKTALRSEGIEESVTRDENEDELVCEPELAEDDEEVEYSQHELELSGIYPSENIVPRKRSKLFMEMIHFPYKNRCVSGALDKWVAEGKDLDRALIAHTMLNLRKRQMYGRALRFSEWLEDHKNIEFDERDYACRVDLIAKVRGLQKAVEFIETIPKSLKGEVIYRILLANCVDKNNVKKVEEVFNKMKDLEFPVTSLTCNPLVLLQKRKKKITDVFLLMEKYVKSTRLTRRLLADLKGQLNGITRSGVGKEQYTFEQMRQALLIPKEAKNSKRGISEASADSSKKQKSSRNAPPKEAEVGTEEVLVAAVAAPTALSFADLREMVCKLQKVEIQPNCKNSELRAEDEELKVAATLGGKEVEL